MIQPSSQRSTTWVKRLPVIVAALNNEVTHLTSKKPADAIEEKAVSSKPSTPYLRPVGVNEEKLPSNVNVRYLYQSGIPVNLKVQEKELQTQSGL